MADAVLDTTVFIDYFNGHPGARKIVGDVLTGRKTGAYSPITVLELWVGLASHEDEVSMQALLSSLEHAPLSDGAARAAAIWLRGTSPRRTESMYRDALIAATAKERGEPVVTRNVRDFGRFGIDVQPY